uniref:C-type lectin domain containing 14A n=1 Tax=Hucho hucho TaxID=62062 RepID=A0A4W5RBX1_9TELE
MEYHWICLWSVLGLGLCIPDDEHYTLHLNPLNFDKALEACLPASFLTKVASMEEATKILKVIMNMPSTEGTFEFWVGLRKEKLDCVKNDTPLNGFKWTVDSSSDTELDQWKSLPEPTCTVIRCVFLSGEFNGTEIVNWGFVPSTCKTNRPYICKQRDEKMPFMDHCLTPHILEARTLKPDPNYPHKLELECRSGQLFKLTCSATTLKWKRDDGSAIDGICASCKAGSVRDRSGNCVDNDECRDQPCKGQCVYTDGSYLCKYHTPTPKPTIQEGSIIIFLPNQPTPTSPTDDIEIVDKSGEQAKIFIPVLTAAMTLVVLVVLVLATVKCCLRRRSQKLAMKTAEKIAMKRAEASKEYYSLENRNEKEAT